MTHKRDPQEIARIASAAMLVNDRTVQQLGIALDSIGPGLAVMSMTIADSMVNGLGACHGGYIFTLADTAFGFACNSHGRHCVGQQCSITYLLPVARGDRLVAAARLRTKQGRTGLYDVTVVRSSHKDGVARKDGRADDEVVAEFRGQSRDVEGAWM